ncbi:MAG: hypothetical protein JXQ73_17585 [Phycisphaerae bacterium]|nr:hypothetical protein [Phycisphaerae bacterium]
MTTMDLRQYFSGTYYRNLLGGLMSGQKGRQGVFAVGGIVGAVVVVGGAYLLYSQVMSLPKPDVQVASAEDLTKFLGHERGFARLPAKEQEQFLARLIEIHTEPARRGDLASALRRMTSKEKMVCREVIWNMGYRALVKDVDEFYKAPPEERDELIDEKIVDYMRAREYVAGNSRARKDHPPLFDDSWLQGMPTDSDGIVKLMISKTRPQDRARLKPYVEKFRARMDQVRKDKREFSRMKAKHGAQDIGSDWK